MYRQSIYGMPTKCLNRSCKHVFYKNSHLGWTPKSETEVYVVMRCPKCKDTFLISQMINMVYEYLGNLPEDPSKKIITKLGPITANEIGKIKEYLHDPGILQSLNDGSKPGASIFPTEDEK